MTFRRVAPALGVVALLLLAGCGAPFVSPGDAGSDGGTGDAADGWRWPDDPPTDRLGWEDGYWYNESIDVNQTDGLNETERRAFVGRTMARIEVLRELEFERSVPVAVVSRDEFRREAVEAAAPDPEYEAWNSQVWEALLLVGEETNVSRAFDDLYGEAVLGYYSPSDDRIVVVSDADAPAVSRGTLAHELVHALQDQQFGIDGSPPTQDAQLAESGLVEGDARLVERLYLDRCGAEWACVPNPPRDGGRGVGSYNHGVFVAVYQPYSDGPALVDALRERGGWDAVNAAYENRPVSTEQVIHPETYPDERPLDVTVPDRSAADWSRFDRDPAADTVGEASLYATFWANGGVDRDALYESDGPHSPYSYESGVTAGWGGDAVVPYVSDDGEYGYVFRTAWDTEADARAFERAYAFVLGARLLGDKVSSDTWVVGSGPFADAFRVTRTGRTVTIVNAPTRAQLDAVHGREG